MRINPLTASWVAALAGAGYLWAAGDGLAMALLVFMTWAFLLRKWRWVVLPFAALFSISIVHSAIQAKNGRFHRDEHAITSSCSQNLRYLDLALNIYATSHKEYPLAVTRGPDGEPLYGWRIEILPYLEMLKIFKELNRNEPWNSPTNEKILPKSLDVFRCPSDGLNETDASYLAVVDPRTAWPPDHALRLDEALQGDGARNTLLLIEVYRRGIPWAKPEDLTFDEAVEILTATPSGDKIVHHSRGAAAGAIHVAFMDGSVELVPLPLSAEAATALLTVNGGEAFDRDALTKEIEKTAHRETDQFWRVTFLTLAILPAIAKTVFWLAGRKQAGDAKTTSNGGA